MKEVKDIIASSKFFLTRQDMRFKCYFLAEQAFLPLSKFLFLPMQAMSKKGKGKN